MAILSGIVLAVRFVLEIVTVLGIFSGIFLKKTLSKKILFLFLSIAVTFIWSRFGAPNSPHVLKGIYKFLLELVVYSIGAVSFYSLFGYQIAIIYTIVVIINLILMYSLGLQGN